MYMLHTSCGVYTCILANKVSPLMVMVREPKSSVQEEEEKHSYFFWEMCASVEWWMKQKNRKAHISQS